MFKADQINRLEDICQTPFVFTPACQPGQESVTNTMECEPSLSVSEAVAVNADKVQEGSDVCSVPEAVAVKPDKGQVGSYVYSVAEAGPSTAFLSPQRPLTLRTGDTTPRKK